MNNADELEQSVLAELESAQPNVTQIISMLDKMARGEAKERALSVAELAEGSLADAGQVDAGLRVLRWRADWIPAADFRIPCANAVQRILGKGAENRAYLKNCGLETRVPVAECLDRLDRLRHLKPATLCLDKTWGFGVVQSVDTFDEKVIIDFDRKAEHAMALGYAAEALSLINEDHILALRQRDPDGLEKMVDEDPGQVVRMALSSYGPLNAIILQEKLSPAIVSPDKWKTFWAAARKSLKSDPDAVVPTKRTEPILIREAAGAFDDGWFRQLKSNRDIESILTSISDWHALSGDQELDIMHQHVIEDRLAFVIKGADLMGKTVMPRAMMLAHSVSMGDDRLGVKAYVDELLSTDKLLAVLEALGARDMKTFIAFLMQVERERTLQALLRLLPRLDITSLSEVLQLLIREGEEEACQQAIKALLASRRAGVEVLSWLSRNMDKLEAWSLCAPMEFAEVVLLEMEKDYTGAQLKAQNQLRDRFTQKTWVKALFDQLGTEGRDRYFQRLKDTSAWPTMEKRSVLGHIIKIYPELEKWMSVTRGGEKVENTKPRGPVTSIRAYRERQLMSEKIQKVDIPNNSKEIAVARAHGDLRENFEYQAAKDAQGLLMRRQAELEQMLAQVVPTEFEGAASDKAGIGTGVELTYSDGRKEHYYILGVWDRDEALGIISSESKLAQALEGHSAGDEVQVPTESGETHCTLSAVTPLSEAVRYWIRDVPESLDGWTPGA